MPIRLLAQENAKKITRTFATGELLQNFLEQQDPAFRVVRLIDLNPKPFVEDKGRLYQGGEEDY